MDKKMKERVLKAANSPRVKADVYIWLKIITGGCVLCVGSLVLTPIIADHIDGWPPLTQCFVTVLFLIGIYIFIKLRNK